MARVFEHVDASRTFQISPPATDIAFGPEVQSASDLTNRYAATLIDHGRPYAYIRFNYDVNAKQYTVEQIFDAKCTIVAINGRLAATQAQGLDTYFDIQGKPYHLRVSPATSGRRMLISVGQS